MRNLIILLVLCVGFYMESSAKDHPRVFILTDINIDSGDPDDRQSLVHLLWYANELEIEGIVPERLSAGGLEACMMAFEAYSADYKKYNLAEEDYPAPAEVKDYFATSPEHASKMFNEAASETSDPLYVLVWGNMQGLKRFLFEQPELSENIRVISIGTGLMNERNMQHVPESWEKEPPCKQMNWNSPGRNDIYNDPRFDDMWWLELNWTYEGMFSGPEPAEMLKKLSEYGKLGEHIKEVVRKEAWAQYFRVGDTPTVLYVIDPGHDLDDPSESSWAGQFVKPFPDKRPNYYTDYSGSVEWDYANPCNTWENHEKVSRIAAGTLEERRQEMYDALLNKLNSIYKSE